MVKIIGIDLGTTNSVVAIMESGEPKVISNEEGTRTTPSVVAYTKNNEILVGQSAKRQAIANPENTIFSAKRFIGSKFNESENLLKHAPFTCVELENENIGFKIKQKQISPQEISAKILQKLKNSAESYLGTKIEKAVITVPAYFNDSQRQATRDAGKIAGLHVERIVNEPTAASLYYGMGKKKEEKIAVYDLGGGTFDISILEVAENVVEVISTNGNTNLGGDDFDNILIKYLIEQFKKDTSLDTSKDKIVIQRFKEAAEKAKIELSTLKETEISLPFLTADANGPKHFNLKLNRATFEHLIINKIKQSIGPCKKAISDAKINISDIKEVILVGGSTRIPAVQKEVKDFFKKNPNKSVNPDEVVALGAAIQAGVLSGEVKDMLLLDVTPLSLGIETLGGVSTILIPRNTTIPSKKTEIFSTASDNQTSVEVHVLQGERKVASSNRTLGRFHLEGIPTAPRGVPQIEVSFDIDANGIVNVSAKDKATNKEQKITITSNSGISDKDIEKMINDAKKHASEDKEKLQLVEEKNKLDSMIYNTEKMLKENDKKINENDKANILNTIKEAKKKINSNNINELKNAFNELTQQSHKIAEIMYKANKNNQEKTPSNDGDPNKSNKNKKSSNVVDAEFEDKKES